MPDLSDFKRFVPQKRKNKAAKQKNPDGSQFCVIYTRVSSKRQEDGYSLETQLKECRKWAGRNGLAVVGEFGGTYESAQSDLERKHFNQMLDSIRKARQPVGQI